MRTHEYIELVKKKKTEYGIKPSEMNTKQRKERSKGKIYRSNHLKFHTGFLACTHRNVKCFRFCLFYIFLYNVLFVLLYTVCRLLFFLNVILFNETDFFRYYSIHSIIRSFVRLFIPTYAHVCI